jgi:hypothetical protein
MPYVSCVLELKIIHYNNPLLFILSFSLYIFLSLSLTHTETHTHIWLPQDLY